jgi:pre-rRNA-processing protein IPI3
MATTTSASSSAVAGGAAAFDSAHSGGGTGFAGINEVVLVTSAKDAGGIAALDFVTGTPVCTNFKNCVADPGSVCLVGGISSYSGVSHRGGDYIVIAQSKKPVIHVWQWNKPQVHMQIHTQEIITSLASDPTGTFLFAGGKKGWIYIWNVTTGALLKSWQAHFKEVSRLYNTLDGEICISASFDGMVKAWNITSLLDVSDVLASMDSNNNSQQAYRWLFLQWWNTIPSLIVAI